MTIQSGPQTASRLAGQPAPRPVQPPEPSGQTTRGDASDPLRGVYLRLVAVESIPPEALRHFSYLRPLATDLLEGIALDTPDNIRLLSDEDVAQVDWNTLYAAARTNLLADPVDYDTVERPGGAVLHLLGSPSSMFAASKALVFDEAVRAAGGPEIPEEGALLTVANRHNLVFYPLADQHVGEAVNDLAQFGLGAYEDGPGRISPRVFWWRGGTLTSISVFDEAAKTMRIAPPEELMATFRRLAGAGG
ncbi:hypothetical protein AB0N09_35870 [Streptomyces erythrochromogenes]|uniref:hypothetical protein n=1 Tax=Streptomyces erythrochromogenes TaxID=285574 RepID=UPI00344121A5